MLAQAIHTLSNRNSGSFIAINSGALTESLVESELFGYAGGTFTGGRCDGKAGLQPGFEQRRHIRQIGQGILIGTEIHPHRYNH